MLKYNYHLIISLTTNTSWNVNMWLLYFEENRLGVTFQKSNVTKRYQEYSTVQPYEGSCLVYLDFKNLNESCKSTLKKGTDLNCEVR